MDLNINGNDYHSVGKLNAFEQFAVARRLLPVISSLSDLRGLANPDAPLDPEVSERALTSIASAIAKLSDADCEYVLNKCLAKVQRRSGAGWQSVLASNNALMFDDIDMVVMMRLAFAVMQENLGGFFPALPQASPPVTPAVTG